MTSHNIDRIKNVCCGNNVLSHRFFIKKLARNGKFCCLPPFLPSDILTTREAAREAASRPKQPMSSPRTHNYLRTHRKRTGLTQDDLAFLLGCKSGTKVSRYERLIREPNLETAFACQAIFGVPAHELFPGIYQNVEQIIKQRAERLKEKLAGTHAAVKYKQQALNSITAPKVVQSLQEV